MVNERYKNGFLRRVKASMNGEITSIPNPLGRMNSVFKLMQNRYTLIIGASGSGKTSLADFIYILGPFTYLQDKPDIHWEILYFSLERKEETKHAKWLSWFIKRDHGMLVPGDDLIGDGDAPVNEEGYKFIRGYDDTMSKLLSHIRLTDGKIDPEIIERGIKRRAHALGVLYYSDEEAVYSSHNATYIERFDDKNLTEQTEAGLRKYVEITHNNTTFKLYEDDRRYFLHNPTTFVFIIVDGINLFTDKKIIDQISIMLANARDIYGFSPVVVSQQNRSMGDIQRLKHHGNDLSPQLEDVYMSSQMSFDADLVLGLFDPHRYKSLDNSGKYLGYTVKAPAGTPSPVYEFLHPRKRFSRFRSAHILKNTYGIDGGAFGLKFTGESNHFDVLPPPDLEFEVELRKIYEEIHSGR